MWTSFREHDLKNAKIANASHRKTIGAPYPFDVSEQHY